jgi:hypothetical protein
VSRRCMPPAAAGDAPLSHICARGGTVRDAILLVSE